MKRKIFYLLSFFLTLYLTQGMQNLYSQKPAFQKGDLDYIDELVKDWGKIAGEKGYLSNKDSKGPKSELETFRKLSALGVNKDNDDKITLEEVVRFQTSLKEQKTEAKKGEERKTAKQEDKDKKEKSKNVITHKESALSKEEQEKKREKYEQYMVRVSFQNLDNTSILERYISTNYLLKYYKGGDRNEELLKFLRHRMISGEDIPACYNMIRLLGKIKASDEQTRNLLLQTLGMAGLDSELRKAAAESLGMIGNNEVLPVLEKHIIWERQRYDKDVFYLLLEVAGKLRGKDYTVSEINNLEEKYSRKIPSEPSSKKE